MATKFDQPFSLTAQNYYGPSLSDPREQPTMWTNRPPSGYYEEAHPTSGIGTAAAVTAGLLGSGFMRVGKDRMWDRYVGAMRAIEEYSPAGILRTFQASTFFSQFTSAAQKEFFVEGHYLRSEAGRKYASYLSTLAGDGPGVHARILREGVRFKEGSLLFGSGETAVKYAGVVLSPTATAIGEEAGFIAGKHFGSGYARSMGMDVSASRGFGTGDARQFGEVFEDAAGHWHRQIIGAQTRTGYAARQAGAWGTELVSRFNRLLEAPFEMQPFKTVFGSAQEQLYKRFGLKVQFAVPYGPGSKMLGSLAWKYGAVAGAIGLGYQSLDYVARNTEALEGTALGEGLTYGLASIWTKANVAASKVADLTGLHSYREAQEEIAPGSTQFSRLAAFPLIGAATAAGASYGALLYKMGKHQRANKELGAAAARTIASQELREFGEKGFLGYLGKKLGKTSGLYSREDMVGKIFRTIASPISQGTDDLAYKFVGKLSPVKTLSLLGAAVGGALAAPFLPGALIPGTRADELERIYSGEQEVAVRKGRWWEFGRTPWEGTRISHYRPHWFARMKMDAKEKAIWGEDYDGLTPFEKWYKKEFTYELEKRHYYDRPYPISSLPFEDVPFVGPLLANTIGRMIKPPVLMHADEWLAEGNAVKAMPPGFGERVATELGEQPPGTPISPYSAQGTIGEQAYRLTEMVGLPGFVMTSIKESLTGTPDLFDQAAQLESARRAFGIERSYWDMEIGGGLGTTEALRRLYPHRRRQVPLYNPIRNTMPEWLPGPGEKSPDFLHGDPYTKVTEGELRLPGAGYAARFPELEGLRPDEYPLIHQYKILADVAPYSDKFKLALQRVRAERKTDAWSEYEENIYDMTQEQLKQRKVKKKFEEYEYLSPMGRMLDNPEAYSTKSAEFLSAINRMKAEGQEDPGTIKKLFGGYWELLAHNAETALDVMTPVSPGAKLVHTRTALEDYEMTQVYGTENAFWSHPVRDFLRPMLTRMGASMGFREIPEHIKERRDIEEYFDVLEYVKSARLSNLARAAGDKEAVAEFERKKNETLFGINPFTYNYSNLFRSLPRRERDYFNSFSAADTTEERAEILELVPENERALYLARWKLQLKNDILTAKKKGLLTEEQLQEADKVVEQIQDEAKSEGFPSSKELFAEYIATKLQGENYADWYRRTKLLPERDLPSADWVGWHPSVDLDDIKLKLVQNMGEDMHEYDLWPSRAQALINKPYLEGSIDQIVNPDELNEHDMIERINDLFLVNNARADVFARTSWNTGSEISVDIEQEPDIEKELARLT